MEHSAGIFVFYRKQLLVVHPSLSKKDKNWGIPKGHIEPGENALGAAKRELYEESNLDLDKLKHIYKPTFFGKQIYKSKKKTLHVFYVFLDDDEKIPELKCNSYIPKDKKWGGGLPENDKVLFMDIDEVVPMIHESQQKLIKYFDVWDE